MILIFISFNAYTFPLSSHHKEQFSTNVLYTGPHGEEYSDELEAGLNTQNGKFLVSWGAVLSLLPITWSTHLQPPKWVLCGKGRYWAMGIGGNSFSLQHIISYSQLKGSKRARVAGITVTMPISVPERGISVSRKEKAALIVTQGKGLRMKSTALIWAPQTPCFQSGCKERLSLLFSGFLGH